MKSKRILSLLLVLGMLASMLPSALAADVSDFTDVSESDWYYEYVDYVAEKGYFQGTSATTFSPAVTMTRAMFVTAVSRVAGETGDAGTAPFDDVPAGTWYTAAVDWATEHGVINGVGGNKFAPEREITREEMCVIMARFIAYLEESQNKTFKKDADPIDFPDADQIADYAKEAVDDCVAYGLVFGTGAGLMAPRALASRAEVAAMIYRLSLMTTESTGGGGGGGGGGGPVGPTATSYTITYKDGDTKLTTRETEKTTDAEKAFTTLGADDIAEKDGYVLVGWKGEDGRAYGLDASYTTRSSMDLYAQWLDSTDYIGNAVAEAMNAANSAIIDKAMDKVNEAAGIVNVNKGYGIDVEHLGYNPGDPANPKADRPQTVTASADVTDDLLVNIITTAASYACTILTDGKPAEDEMKDDIDDLIASLKGLLGLSDVTLSDKSNREIAELIYANVIEDVRPLWAYFKDPDTGMYYTGDVTIEAGSATVTVKVDTQTTVEGGRMAAAKKLAEAVAKEMYADLKTYGDYTSDVKLDSTVTFKFSENENDQYDTSAYSYDYPVTLYLTLNGGDLVEYRFDSASNQSYVKLNVTQDVQKKYAEQLNKVVKAALSSDAAAVKNELKDKIGSDILNKDDIKKLVDVMVKIGMVDEDAAKDKVKTAMSDWLDDNMKTKQDGEGTGQDDEGESTLFKIWWKEDPNAAYNNNAIYDLVDTVANAAAEFVNNKLDEIAGGNPLIQIGIDAMKAEATPDLLESALLNPQYNIDISAILALNDYPEIKLYIYSVICDYLNAQVKGENTHLYTNTAAPAMKAWVDEMVRGAIEGSSYYKYLVKSLKLKTVETMADLQLGNLATLLRKPTFLNFVDGRGASLLERVTNLIGRLPEGASVEMNGVTLNKAALAGIRNADTTVDACKALANLIDQDGLRDLTLNSFSGEGMEITVRYNARTFTFNLVVDVVDIA